MGQQWIPQELRYSVPVVRRNWDQACPCMPEFIICLDAATVLLTISGISHDQKYAKLITAIYEIEPKADPLMQKTVFVALKPSQWRILIIPISLRMPVMRYHLLSIEQLFPEFSKHRLADRYLGGRVN